MDKCYLLVFYNKKNNKTIGFFNFQSFIVSDINKANKWVDYRMNIDDFLSIFTPYEYINIFSKSNKIINKGSSSQRIREICDKFFNGLDLEDIGYKYDDYNKYLRRNKINNVFNKINLVI